jgi:hypothetical protein
MGANLCSILSLVAWLACFSAGSAATISKPKVQAGVFSFSFDSTLDQLYTVQGTTTLSTQWVDVAFQKGTGNPILFSTQATGNLRFFRVKLTPFETLQLFPDSPTLASGPVSLPDAAVGAAYSESIASAGTGVPPYTMEISGSPPDGMNLMLVNNETAEAAVQVVATGAGLVADQRRQFTVTVIDGAMTTNSHNYDIRVVGPPPTVNQGMLLLKAGQAVNMQLRSTGGTAPLTWTNSGLLPAVLSLSSAGLLTGTLTADAAERNENGRYTNTVVVSDSFTDRVTGAPAPRRVTNTVEMLVRLSYNLNIRATRTGGPSLRQTCFSCHGPGFEPNFDSTSATAIIDQSSGSGGECGTARVYVEIGVPLDSLIYTKLLSNAPCGDRMPQGGPFLSAQRLGRLARWIDELQPGDTD